MTATPIVALDVATRVAALGIVERLGESCGFYKVGSELFTAEGPEIVGELRRREKEVFLDLKFHDIPNTVAAAVASAARLGASLVTVHASGGRAMLAAAATSARGASGSGRPCKVLAVSVLTSLDGAALGEAWGRSNVGVGDEVLRLARLARDSGVDGLVCSAHEAASVRNQMGPGFELLVPGIRLAGGAAHDQARVATPTVAIRSGATYLVLGRAVTSEADPREAMAAVLAEIAAAV